MYYATGKKLYSGDFLNNAFHGKGILTIHLLQLANDYPIPSNELLPLQNPLEDFNIEIDGNFKEGKFQGGVWRFTGLTGRVSGRIFTLTAQGNSDSLSGKLLEGKQLVYEGHFDKFVFDG